LNSIKFIYSFISLHHSSFVSLIDKGEGEDEGEDDPMGVALFGI
jgi:hypothetical protein